MRRRKFEVTSLAGLRDVIEEARRSSGRTPGTTQGRGVRTPLQLLLARPGGSSFARVQIELDHVAVLDGSSVVARRIEADTKHDRSEPRAAYARVGDSYPVGYVLAEQLLGIGCCPQSGTPGPSFGPAFAQNQDHAG